MAGDPHESASPGREGAGEPARSGNLRAEVLARMGHELRTPLNAIIGFIRLVEEGLYTTEDERRDYLASARQSALTLLDLINNILDLARIEAGRMALESVELSVADVVEEVAKTLAPEAHAKGVEIDALVDPTLPPRLKSDPVRLRQVLYNLAGNAVKFTDDGLVLLRAALEETDREASRVRFTVQDTGIGINEELQATIFESFVQTTDPHANRLGGVGLGLSIARQIVEQMGGAIGLQSQVGRGSTFSFTVLLPRGRTYGGGARARGAALAGTPVLLLNPDAVTGEPELEKLGLLGLRAERAATPEEALAAMRREQTGTSPIRAVLVDHHLRRDDALVFARRVRREAGWFQPELVHLTIIGATGDVAVLREAGFSAFVTKPVSPESLRGVLASLLDRQGAGGAPENTEAVDGTAPLVRTRGRRGLVLVAEDNLVNQKLIQALLSKEGYGTRLVNNGQEALDALHGQRYDLVLMDVQMPVMDGLTAARAIRERPEGGTVPIIAMTADALDGDRERCLAAGMNDHVPKPIMPDVLSRALARWISGAGRAVEGTAPESGDAAERGDPAAKEPVLDVAHLDAVHAYAHDHDPARFTALLETFRTEARTALDALAKATRGGDRSAVRAAAHRLELASAGFGAPRLHALAAHVAAQAAQEPGTRSGAVLERLLPELEAALEGVDAALAARFGNGEAATPGA